MNPSPEPLIVVSRPCPRRARAIEKLIAGTLGAPDREAVERHLGGCPKCRGYRDWLRLESSTARDLAGRRARKISLEQVRGRLEQQIARMREAEAARALVRLGIWHYTRRQNANPTLYVAARSRARQPLVTRFAQAVERLKSTPWRSTTPITPDCLQTLATILDDPRSRHHREACRLLLDTAVTLDSGCHLARVARGYLIREEGYREIEVLEKDREALLASDDPSLQAQAFTQEAAHCSIVTGDLQQAIALEEKAHRLAPQIIHSAFNAWFLSLVTAAKSRADLNFDALRLAITTSLYQTRARRSVLPSLRAVLNQAQHDGFLTQSKHTSALKQLNNLCGE